MSSTNYEKNKKTIIAVFTTYIFKQLKISEIYTC